MGDKSEKTTVGFWYRMGLHFGICHGPINELNQILVGDRVAWCGVADSNQSINIQARNLFGGKSREGGVSGSFDVMMGGPSQTKNNYLVDKLGETQPAYRGIFGGVFNRGYVSANNPYVKPWAFTLQRQTAGWQNNAPFYEEKAKIILGTQFCGDPDECGNIAIYFALDFSGTMHDNVEENGLTRLQNMKNAVEDALEYIKKFQFTNTSIALCAWGNNAREGVPEDQRSTRIEYDADDEAIDSLISWLQLTDTVYWTYFPAGVRDKDDFFTNAGANKNILFFITDGLPTCVDNACGLNSGEISSEGASVLFSGVSPQSYGINIELENTTHTAKMDNTLIDGVPIVAGGDPAALTNAITTAIGNECSLFEISSMNPAHIIYECLTNAEWGMGYPSSFIDEDNFTEVADALFDEEFGLCGIWNRQEEIQKFVTRVLNHCGAIQQVDRRTGKFKLKLIRDDYNPDTLPVFSEDEIISMDSFERPGYGDLINEISVTYDDVFTTKQGGVTLQNLASVQAQEGIVSATRQYPMLPTIDLALRVAQRDLMEVSVPLARLKITCNRSAWDVEPGDVIKVSWPKLGIDSLICRVMDADYGTIDKGQIKLTLSEDVYGLPASSFTVEQPSGFIEPDTRPDLIDPQDILEAPYYNIATNYPASDFNVIADNDDIGFIRTVGARPTDISMGYHLNTKLDVDSDYEEEPGIFSFSPTALLSVDIGKTDTVLSVDELIGAEEIEVGSNTLAMIGTGRDAEWVQILTELEEGTEGQQCSVNRGMLDTVPQEWEAGSRIWWITDNLGVDLTEYTHADDVNAKLTDVAPGGETDVADAIAMNMTMDSRFGRPYPPGKFRINDEQYPEAPEFPITISWTHRDREQQTAGLIGQDASNIGPEGGTTYNARLYASDVLVDEITGITGTDAEFEENTSLTVNLRIELESERDGIVSWHHHEHEFTYVVSDWTPEQLFLASEGGAWYDPSDLSTLWQDTGGTTPAGVGDSVARMDDKSGNGNHIIAGAGSEPTLRQDGNGNYYLEFDGTQEMTQGGFNSVFKFLHDGNGMTLFAGAYFGEVANPNAIYALCGSNGLSNSQIGFGLWWDDRAGVSFNEAIRCNVTDGDGSPPVINFSQNNGLAPQTPAVLGVTYQTQGGDDSYLYLDGSQIASVGETDTPSSANSTQNFGIGRAAGSTFNLVGGVYGLVAVDRVISSEERTELNAFISGKLT